MYFTRFKFDIKSFKAIDDNFLVLTIHKRILFEDWTFFTRNWTGKSHERPFHWSFVGGSKCRFGMLKTYEIFGCGYMCARKRRQYYTAAGGATCMWRIDGRWNAVNDDPSSIYFILISNICVPARLMYIFAQRPPLIDFENILWYA